MYVGSELTIYKSRDNYLVDALRLSLSISPYSVPCDTSAGLEVERDNDVADIVRYQVIQILKSLDATKDFKCTGCYVRGNTINVEIRDQGSGEILSYSFL